MELVDDFGRRMALIRPDGGGPDRVLAVDSGEDITNEFVRPDGRIDFLAGMGLTVAEARRQCRLTGAEMAVESQGDTLLTALASVDQDHLWSAADGLIAAEARLQAESEAAGALPEDAPLIEEIERRHTVFEKAERRHETLCHHGILIGETRARRRTPRARHSHTPHQ